MKNIFIVIFCVIIVVCCGSLYSCIDNQKSVALDAPVPVLDSASLTATSLIIAWGRIENAWAYVYTFNGETEKIVSATSASFDNLTAGTLYVMKIKALAIEDSKYIDSQWVEFSVRTMSEKESPIIDKIPLDTPKLVVRQNDNEMVVTWPVVENAVSYECAVDDDVLTVTKERMFIVDMLSYGEGNHTITVIANPVNESIKYEESEPAIAMFTVEPDCPIGDLSEWYGTYTLRSSHKLVFSDENNMELVESGMTISISIEPSSNPDYANIWGFSVHNDMPLLATLVRNENTGVVQLGIMTEKSIIACDEDGNDMSGVPIAQYQDSLTFIVETPWAFVIDPTTLSFTPCVGFLAGGQEFKIVAIDIFSVQKDYSVLKYFEEYPVEIPACEFCLTRMESASDTAFVRSLESLESNSRSASGLSYALSVKNN